MHINTDDSARITKRVCACAKPKKILGGINSVESTWEFDHR